MWQIHVNKIQNTKNVLVQFSIVLCHSLNKHHFQSIFVENVNIQRLISICLLQTDNRGLLRWQHYSPLETVSIFLDIFPCPK